jgi:hypothetical protein
LRKGQIQTLKNSQKITWDMSLTNHHLEKQKGENKNGCQHYIKKKKFKGKEKERGGPSGVKQT